MASRSSGRLASLLSALLLAPAGAAAFDCDGIGISVTGATPEAAGRLCEVARQFAADGGICGLPIPDGIQVRLTDLAQPNNVHCLASYECGTATITLTKPEQFEQLEMGNSAFGVLPEQTLLESLLVHELVHAALHATGTDTLTPLEHEYLAYAHQVAHFPPAEHARFMRGNWPRRPAEPEEINLMILGMAPDYFAARAWIHFTDEGNGCAQLPALLAPGEFFPEMMD